MTYAGSNSHQRKLRTIAIGFVAFTVAVSVLAWCVRGHGGYAVRLAKSPDRAERLQAIDLLRRRTDDIARETLWALCSDGDLRVAITAVWALGEGIGPRDGEMLRAILADKGRHGQVRGAAAEQLGKLKAVDPAVLTQALLDDGDPQVRAGAARGLAHLHSLQTMGALLKALSDVDKEVRRRAIEAMNTMMTRRFGYRPELSAEQQPKVMEDIKDYLRQGGVL